MSETIEATGDSIELPTKAEAEQWMTELEQRGDTVELECGQCGTSTETRVLPEERDDETQKTICRSCAASLI